MGDKCPVTPPSYGVLIRFTSPYISLQINIMCLFICLCILQTEHNFLWHDKCEILYGSSTDLAFFFLFFLLMSLSLTLALFYGCVS